MWWSRRQILIGAAALGGCGFTPVYGPGGSGSALQGAVALPEPQSTLAYLFNRRFEERMGRAAAGAPYRLELGLKTEEQELGSTSGGDVTRNRLLGRAEYSLVDTGSDRLLHRAQTNAFTGYSTTGSTVATRAAEGAARERLMVLLADQVIDDLLLAADDLGT